MADSFRQQLNRFITQEMNKGDAVSRQELTERFVKQYPLLVKQKVQELTARGISQEIKNLCESDATDQLPIFDGFPAAVAVERGSVKGIRACDIDDLNLAEEHRMENIKRASQRLTKFRNAKERFQENTVNDDETVGDVTDRLTRRGETA